MSKSSNGTLHVVFYRLGPGDPVPPWDHPNAPKSVVRLKTVDHGEDMVGTNPVAVVHGRLCSRKKGCQWCAGLRDRIRSRTIR